MEKRVKFLGIECSVKFSEYPNGQTKIQLYDLLDGAPYCTATAPSPEPLMEEEVAIKNWSENEGILDALVAAEIIYAPHHQIRTGYANLQICNICD